MTVFPGPLPPSTANPTLSARILRHLNNNPKEYLAQSFDETTFEFTDDDHQAILDAYSKLHPELAIVATTAKAATKNKGQGIAPSDYAKAVVDPIWQQIKPTVGGAGFLRLHAALLVGGHLDKFTAAVVKAPPVAASIQATVQSRLGKP